MNFKLYVFAAFVLLSVASCKKNDDAPATGLTTTLNVINASENTLNYYLNGTRINISSSLYPLGASGYISVAYGAQNYQFKLPGSSVTLFSLPLTLDTSKTYSLFIAGSTPEQAFRTIDTLAADTSQRSVIRFVHTSPDAGNLDVLVGDTVNFKVRAFKSASVFLPVNSGNKHIRIYQTGSAVPVDDELRILQPGRVYTLFTTGKVNGTGNAIFATGLVVNK